MRAVALWPRWSLRPLRPSPPSRRSAAGRVDTAELHGGGDTIRTAALTVTRERSAWASEYCTIGKMYKAERALYIEGRCSKGGLATTHPITLAMKGERLAVTWNGERTELRRCPGSY